MLTGLMRAGAKNNGAKTRTLARLLADGTGSRRPIYPIAAALVIVAMIVYFG